VVCVFGAAVVLFAAVEDVSLAAGAGDVLPAIDAVFDAPEPALVDALDVGGADDGAIESVDLE